MLGDGATLPAVASLAGLSEDRTAEGLSGLIRAQVLSDQQPLAFVHPIVRDAIYSSLPAVERGRWHERAAATLRSLHANDEQVAAHLLLGPPRGDDAVVSLLRTAAQAAADRGAPESAATYLRRALVEDPGAPWRADVLQQLGLLEVAFDGPAGAEHLEQAYHLHPDPRVRADIALAAASTHVFASPPGFATSFARRAQALLPDDLDDHRQGLVALQRLSGFLHAVQEGWRTPAPEPRGQGPGAQMVAATLALEALVDGTDRERAVSMARFCLDGDRLLAVDDGLFWVNAAAVRTLSDDPLDDFWTRARSLARARGSLFATLSINLWEGFWRWQRGELAEALACLRDALEQDRMWGGTGLGEPLARGFQIGCHLDRGDPVAARQAADALAAEGTFGEGGRIFQLALARLLVTEGRPDEALAALEAAPRGVGIRNPAWNPWRALRAEALHALGRSTEALALADEQVALLRRWGAPSYLGRGLCLRGMLRREDGVEDLREAVRVLAPTPAAVALTRAQCALGGLAGVDDDEAVPLLQEACRTAVRRGARGLQARAQALLERRGHPVERCADVGRPLSLTEQQILALTASGLAPDEVARRLFLTVATVLTVLDDLGDTPAAPAARTTTSSRSQPAPAMLGARSDRRPT